MRPKTSNLNEQFIKLSSGDVKAFDSIFIELYAPLVLFSTTFVKNKAVAEDIVSDVFFNLWNDRHKYKDVNYGKTYLSNSVRNRSIDYLRKNNKISNIELDEIVDIDIDFNESEIVEIELYTYLSNIISTLPKKCSNILKLKLDGLSDKEISEKMGIAFETVRSHQKRGFTLIRNQSNKTYSIILFM